MIISKRETEWKAANQPCCSKVQLRVNTQENDNKSSESEAANESERPQNNGKEHLSQTPVDAEEAAKDNGETNNQPKGQKPDIESLKQVKVH